MKKLIVVLDDRMEVSSTIKKIVNKERYSEIVLKKIRVHDLFENRYKEFVDDIYLLQSEKENNEFKSVLENYESDVVVAYIPTYIVIKDDDLFVNLLQKIRYTNDNIIFDDIIKIENRKDNELLSKEFETINEDIVVDISTTSNFFKFISNEADVRHFNALTTDGYTFLIKN